MRQILYIASLSFLLFGCDSSDPPVPLDVAVDVDVDVALAVADSSEPDLRGVDAPPTPDPDLPFDPCPLPVGPCLPVLHLGAVLPFHASGLPLEVGIGPGVDAPAPDAWTSGSSLALETLGPQVIFARVDGCDDGPSFACPTDVREAYPGPAGSPDSEAIAADDASISGWAAGAVSYEPGDAVDEEWTDPDKAAGPAEGGAADILCLGRGGSVTLSFSEPIQDGLGPDLAVFENSFSATFLELAYVEVGTDGVTFARFDSISLTPDPVPPFGAMDPTLIHGLAGTVGKGFGTPFDLAALVNHPAVEGGAVDLGAIHFVRLVDVVGDGGDADSLGGPIYDPYPTVGSAGFDLDGIAVLGG